jgi:hypothetical protein
LRRFSAASVFIPKHKKMQIIANADESFIFRTP